MLRLVSSEVTSTSPLGRYGQDLGILEPHNKDDLAFRTHNTTRDCSLVDQLLETRRAFNEKGVHIAAPSFPPENKASDPS